jgi:hypothetical protein
LGGDFSFFALLGFAADGGIPLALEEIFVNNENDYAGDDQENTEYRRHFQIVLSDPEKIGIGG